MALIRPKGLIPGVLTAFTDDYKLDEEKYREHIQWLIEKVGINGLGITAGTGEFYALSEAEFKRCQEIAVETGKGKVQLWSNFGAEAYEKTLRLCNIAQEAGMDAFRIIHPYYASYTPGSLYDYYASLAKEFPDMSIMLYPQVKLTGRPFPIEIMIELADIDNIVGVKIDTYTFAEVSVLHLKTRDKDFAIVPATVTRFYHMCKSGIQTQASIGPEPQWAPKLCRKVMDSCLNQEWDEAFNATKALVELCDVVTGDFMNFPAQAKAASRILGRPLGPCRRPIVMPSAEHEERIRKALIAAGEMDPN